MTRNACSTLARTFDFARFLARSRSSTTPAAPAAPVGHVLGVGGAPGDERPLSLVGESPQTSVSSRAAAAPGKSRRAHPPQSQPPRE